ncbi:hypothetical protein BH10PSE3_BH10PSE3_08820 [soil metagenome]
MDLLDRYLAAVAALLPKEQREDIVAELRDTLLNQMEEKEAELGRPLTTKEREAVLRAFGHPIAVAGRYAAPRALIGPELYPFYMFAVKGLLILAAAVTAIPLVISVILGGEPASGGISHFLSGFISSALTLIGVATVVAAGIERGWIPVGGFLDWRVADLPSLGKPGRKLKSRFEASFELSALLLFILWWTGAVEAPWAPAIGKHGVFLAATSIWTTLYWPILALAVYQAIASLVTLIRPEWVRVRAAFDVVADLAGLAVVAVLWRAGRLVEVATLGANGPKAADIADLQASLDLSFHITVAVMAVIFVGKLVVSIWRLAKGASAARAALA